MQTRDTRMQKKSQNMQGQNNATRETDTRMQKKSQNMRPSCLFSLNLHSRTVVNLSFTF